jgi:hypothetical protein
MTKYTNKLTEVTVDIGDGDQLPGVESDWHKGGTLPKAQRRRADTGTVPVQRDQSGR